MQTGALRNAVALTTSARSSQGSPCPSTASPRQTMGAPRPTLGLVRATDADSLAAGVMTTIGMTQAGDRAVAPARSGSRVRELLLVCGVLSSLLYVATDVLGGMRYEGYS